MKKLIDKKLFKKAAKCCFFCGEDDYSVLDCHRIITGEDGGEYTPHNTLCVCSNCHRRCHTDQIIIDRKYDTTAGKYVLHYWEHDEEKWKMEDSEPDE